MQAGVKFKTVDEYFSTLPNQTKQFLATLRETIKQAAPGATEVISYNMPAIKMRSVLVYYAAQKNHIGFYPTASPIEVFKNELYAYKCSKGTIQLPMDKPLPVELVSKIVKFRVGQDLEMRKK